MNPAAKRRSALLALLWTSTCAVPAAASPVAASEPPIPAPRPIHFHRLSNRDGLSQMTVGAIVQDRLGFLWFGTGEGLNRFDGLRFSVFRHDPNDPGSLPKGQVEALALSRSGDLWIGTDVGGLVRFDPVLEEMTRPQRTAGSESPAAGGITSLLEDSAGGLWTGTRSGLYRLDPATGIWAAFRHHPGDPESLSHDTVFDLAPAASGRLWVATGAGLDRFDPATGRWRRFRHRPGEPGSLGPGEVRRLDLDPAGTLWVGTWGGGLHRFEAAAERFTRFPNGDDPIANRVRSLASDRSGALWIGTQGRGLFRFDPATGRFERYQRDATDPHSLSGNSVFSLYEDHGGALWAGTWGYGVNRFDPRAPTFRTERHDPGERRSLIHNSVGSVLEDRSGNLWVGTHGGGLSVRAPGESGFVHLPFVEETPAGLSGRSIHALLQDRRGILWVGSHRGIDVLDAERRVVRRYRHDAGDPSSLGDEVVRCLLEDRSGTIWIGTRNAGLDRFDAATGGFVHHRHDPGDPDTLASDRIHALLEGPDGELWIGTGGGLAVRSPGIAVRPGVPSTFRRYVNVPGDPSSLRGDVVLALFTDRAGTLWVGTQGGGLNRFDRGSRTFTAYTEAGGLANDVVYAIAEDQLGRLWLGTNRGLSRFDPGSDSWASYDPADGLAGYELNTGAVALRADGRMTFGGIDGLTTFRPEAFRDDQNPPPVVLTAFEIFQQPVAAGPRPPYLKRVELAADENFFSFEFAALSFRRADKNRYAYRLEGLEEEWVDAGLRRFASYTSVPPGDYLFRVRAANADGVWNQQGLSVRLEIAPPWWARWWAYLAYLAIALASVAAFAAAQRRKALHRRSMAKLLAERTTELRQREQLVAELERFNRTVSHDLRNPLITIKNYTGRILQNAGSKVPEEVSADLGRIDAAADQMGRLLDELILYSRIVRQAPAPRPVALGEVVDAARQRLAEVFEAAGFGVEIAPDLPPVAGDPALLLVVFENLLDNAMRFAAGAESPHVEIGWRWGSRPAEVEIYVRDNGIGIAAAYHQRVFELFERLSQETPGTGVGLALVRRIVEAHGGRVWVESDGPGRGSTFRFTLPRDPGGA